MRELRDPNEWRRACQELKVLGREYGAILIGFTPLDILYDLASLMAGRDLLSGHQLTTFETVAILVGFFSAGLGDDILGGGSRLLRNLDDADDVAARAGRGLSHLDEATALRLSRLDDFTGGDRALLRGDDLRRALGGFDDDGSALTRRLDAVAERRAAEVWVKAGVDRETANKLAKKGLLPIAGGSGADDAARTAWRVDEVISPNRALVSYDPEFAQQQLRLSRRREILDIMAKPYLSDVDMDVLGKLMLEDIEAEGSLIIRGRPSKLIVQKPGEPSWVRYEARHELFHEWEHFDTDRLAGWLGVQPDRAYALTEIRAYSWGMAHREILGSEGWQLIDDIIGHWEKQVKFWRNMLVSE